MDASEGKLVADVASENLRMRFRYNRTLLHLFRTRLRDQSLRAERHPAEPAHDGEQLPALIKMYTLHKPHKFNMRE